MILQSQIIRRLHKSYQLASESAGLKNFHHSSSVSAGLGNIVSESDWIRVNSAARVFLFDWLYLTKWYGWPGNLVPHSIRRSNALICTCIFSHATSQPLLSASCLSWCRCFKYMLRFVSVFFFYFIQLRVVQNSRNFKNLVLWNELIKVELPPWKV